MSEANKAIVRQVIEGFARGNFDAIEKNVAPNVVDHGALPGLPAGVAGYRGTLQAYWAAFQPKVAIQSMAAEGDIVATRWTYDGKHVGPFMGQKPTGRAIKGDVHAFDRIANGKIVEEWVQFDNAALMAAIGLIPEMATAR
jgi:predicted ester cyclase